MFPRFHIRHHLLKFSIVGILIAFNVTVLIGQHSRLFHFGEYDQIIFNNSDFRLVFKDLRKDTTRLGFIVRENYKNPIPILTKESIANSLQNIVIQGRTNSEVPILYLRLIKLEVAEYETIGVDSRIELVADFVIQTSDGFRIVDRKGLIVSQTGSKVLRKHRKKIINLVQQVIDDFNGDVTMLEGRVANNRISSLTDLGQVDYRIYGEELKFGLYEDVFQFRSNNPAITSGYRVKWDPATTKEKILVEIESVETGKIIKDIWGFCDGRHTFIKLGRGYYLLKIGETQDSVSFIVDTKRINEDLIFYGGLLGGSFGALLGAIIAEETAKWGVANFSVDLATGCITSDLDPTVVAPGLLTIFRNTKSKSPEEITVFVNDVPIGSLLDPKSMIDGIEIKQLAGSVIRIRRGIVESVMAIDRFENSGSKQLFFVVEERKDRIRLRKLTSEQTEYHQSMIKRYNVRKKK